MKNEKRFFSVEAEILYELVISFNKSIMKDKSQQSIHQFKVINESSLINYCNTIFSTKPFSDELYCK